MSQIEHVLLATEKFFHNNFDFWHSLNFVSRTAFPLYIVITSDFASVGWLEFRTPLLGVFCLLLYIVGEGSGDLSYPQCSLILSLARKKKKPVLVLGPSLHVVLMYTLGSESGPFSSGCWGFSAVPLML